MQLRVKKISGAANDPSEKFSLINDKTGATVCGPCSIQELQLYLETHEKKEAKRRELRSKLNKDILKARTIFDQKQSGDDLQFADPDSDFSYNPNAKPKI